MTYTPKPGDLCRYVTVDGVRAVAHEPPCPEAGTITDVMGRPVTGREDTA